MNNWDLISFVKSSDKRFQILSLLKDAVSTPSDISKKLDIPISHVSSTLSELSERDLIVCLTPERRKTKLFETTETGKSILLKIEDIA